VLLESVLAPNPDDIAVRYTILSHLLWLTTDDEESTVAESIVLREEAGARHVDRDVVRAELGPSGYRSLLQHFLCLLVIESCNDWSRIRWELDNCRACQGAELVLGLLSHAEAINAHDGDELLLIRAQFRFLSAYAEQVDAFLRNKEIASGLGGLEFKYLVGSPEILTQDSLPHFILLLWCVHLKEDQPLQQKDTIDQLASAAFEIATALRHKPQFEQIYRQMLARCQFATAEFSGAAESYLLLLKQPRRDILEPIKFPI
jgi:hypothetical protein